MHLHGWGILLGGRPGEAGLVIRPARPRGHAGSSIICPHHRWTYHLDGILAQGPGAEDPL